MIFLVRSFECYIVTGHPVILEVQNLDSGPSSESTTTKAPEFPLDSGPSSYQHLVPATRTSLPRSPESLHSRSPADLESFEAALVSHPGQPISVRKKFSNANPESLAIAKAARAMEWQRMFGVEGTI